MKQAYRMSMGDAIDTLLAELDSEGDIISKFTHSRYADQLYMLFKRNPFLLMVITDQNAKILDSSYTWLKYLGWSEEELNGTSFMNYIHPDDYDRTLGAHENISNLADTDIFYNRYRCKYKNIYSFEENGEHYVWIAWQTNVAYKETDRTRVSLAQVVEPFNSKFTFLQERYGSIQ